MGSRVPERNLFVCFPESDGGHSYLAAREIFNPRSIAHLLFRNTVAESFEAVAAGQATFAVVPFYNSITQWDGATLKALASGGYEVFAQVCMPTSYVLVAHTDYIDEFLQTYTSVKDLGPDASPEDKAKIYTRFLTRIYVGAHADEQYRGRLIRPDLKNSTVELSRNPLRILEELSRSDQMMQMMKYGRVEQNSGRNSDKSGGSIMLGTTARVLDTVQAPAALVAAGLLDAPGDPDGWDQPGSLGEIVSLLRKLLVLLNVYSFGAPDLPENTTQYLLIGRRGETAPAKDALKLPATVTTRIMTMVRPVVKKSSADQWLKPFNDISRIVKQFGFVFDRAPVTVASAKSATFLYEGGKLKDGVLSSPGSILGWLFGESTGFSGKDRTMRKLLEKKTSDKPTDGRFFLGEYPSWCYQGIDPKPNGASRCCDEPHATASAEPDPFPQIFQWLVGGLIALTIAGLVAMFLWCPLTGACGTSSFRPQELQTIQPTNVPSDAQQTPPGGLPPADNASQPPGTSSQAPGTSSEPPALAPSTNPPVSEPAQPSTYPGVKTPGTSPSSSTQPSPGTSSVALAPTTKPPVTAPAQPSTYPGVRTPATTSPSISQPSATPAKPPVTSYPGAAHTPKVTVPLTPASPAPATAQPPRLGPISVFHVAFFEGKSNLTSDSMNALASAASQVVQLGRPAKIRAVALGPKENDETWNRRRLAIEDELVRQGIPRSQITTARAGSQLLITIRPANAPAPASSTGKRAALQLDSVKDPMMGDY